MGVKLHTGVHHRYDKATNPESCPKGADLQSKPTKRPLQGGRKDGHKTGNNCRTQGTGCQRLPLPVIQCPKKGRGNQTDNQPKGVEQVCRNSSLQDGRDLHAKRHPKTRRLDDQGRPEGCIFYDPNGPKPETASPLQMAGGNIPVQLPAIRTVVSTVGLYQDHEASDNHPQVDGPENDHLHRRHSDHGRDKVSRTGTHGGPCLPPRESGIHNKLSQISFPSNTGNRHLGIHSELQEHGDQNAREEVQAYKIRSQKAPGNKLTSGTEPITLTGQTQPCRTSNTTSPALLQKSTRMPPHCLGAERGAGLLRSNPANSRCEGGAELVESTPYQMEWAEPIAQGSRLDHRNRCLEHGLGSPVRRHQDRGALVQDREPNAHKLSGTPSSITSSEMLCQRQGGHLDPSQDGQCHGPHLHQQVRGDSLSRAESTDQRNLAVVLRQTYNTTCQSSGGCPQYCGGRRVAEDERQDRLETLSPDIQQNQQADRTSTSGPVCIPPDTPTARLRQLEARPRSDGNRCLHSELVSVSGICKPTMEFSGKSSSTNTTAESTSCTSGASLESPNLVPNTAGNANPGTSSATELTRPNPTDSQSQHAGYNPTTSRMGYLRGRFQSQRLSEEASELLLASWRQKTAKSYDSLFRKWLGWCSEWNTDPISGDISEVVNFLAHLFKQGYQYRSLNAYRSAISSVHEKVDGYAVGQHPLVSRLIKGAFHERPPQPQYSVTWDVSKVTLYLKTLGNNNTLTISELTLKTVMLLALTRPSRSADLANLSLGYHKYSPEGVTFTATKLAKQSSQTKGLTEFFFPKFPNDEALCPVVTLKAYEERTRERRSNPNCSQLFIALIRPYNPVTSSTIARWIKSVLTKSGINTDIFKAHSVRSAATSAAANAGVTTNDILKAADWSSESVFQKFYYKPEKENTFGVSVLAKLPTTSK